MHSYSADMRRDVQEIFRATPHEKQVMMFSATLSKEIRPVCKKFMQDVNTTVSSCYLCYTLFQRQSVAFVCSLDVVWAVLEYLVHALLGWLQIACGVYLSDGRYRCLLVGPNR